MKEESADHCTIENMKRTLKIIALFLVVCMFMTACGGKSGADNSYYYDDEAYAPMPEPVPLWAGQHMTPKQNNHTITTKLKTVHIQILTLSRDLS